jgi:hypothetical protein
MSRVSDLQRSRLIAELEKTHGPRVGSWSTMYMVEQYGVNFQDGSTEVLEKRGLSAPWQLVVDDEG